MSLGKFKGKSKARTHGRVKMTTDKETKARTETWNHKDQREQERQEK